MRNKDRLLWAHGAQLLGFQDMTKSHTMTMKDKDKLDDMEKFLGGLIEEFAQGMAIDTPFLWIVGQKPL
jgi:hypothetical protein